MTNKIAVTVSPKALVAKTEQSVEALVGLQNLGPSIDQLDISLDGLENDWYTLPISSVALFPNDKDELKIILSPPKSTKVKAGVYPFRVKVRSQANPGESSLTDMTLTVQVRPEFEVSMTPPSIRGSRGIYNINFNNPGENEVRLNLQVTDTHGVLQYQLKPEHLIIPAASRSQANLESRLEWLAFFGGEKEFPFQVLATTPEIEEVKTLDAKLVRVAWYKMLPQIRFPRIKLPHFILALWQRPPMIETFGAKTDDRTTFKLSWAVKRAKDVRLNDENVEPISEKVLSPTSLSRFVLTATNKYGTLEKTVEVEPRVIPQEKISERIRASLSTRQLRLQMGGIPEMVSIQLQNLGEIVDKFLIDIEGIDPSWYNRSAASIALMPQTTEMVQVTFQIPKKKGAKARTYPFAVSIRSQTTPSDVTIVNGNIEVVPFVDYKLKVAPFRVSCRSKGTFRVGLANTGTSEARVELDATDLDEGLRFKFKKKEVVVPAWETIEIPVTAKPKKGGLVGEKKRYDIVITSNEASGNTQTVNAELYHNPLVRSWQTVFRFIRALIFIAVIVVAIVLLIKYGGGFSLFKSSPKAWWDSLVEKLTNLVSSWF